jgi:phosphopantetheinyl transferase (holo-ACP synthase)
VILGIGVDLINNKDFQERTLESPLILKKLLGPNPNLPEHRRLEIATSNFAALEALFKALPQEFKSKVNLFTVDRDSYGRPFFDISRLESMESLSEFHIHLSISNHGDYTVALVIIENTAEVN